MKTRSLIIAALLGLSSPLAFAQDAALSAELAQQVQQAAAAGNVAAIAQLAAQNPGSAATIAKAAAQANPAQAAVVAAAVATAVPAAAPQVAAGGDASQLNARKSVASRTSSDPLTPSLAATLLR